MKKPIKLTEGIITLSMLTDLTANSGKLVEIELPDGTLTTFNEGYPIPEECFACYKSTKDQEKIIILVSIDIFVEGETEPKSKLLGCKRQCFKSSDISNQINQAKIWIRRKLLSALCQGIIEVKSEHLELQSQVKVDYTKLDNMKIIHSNEIVNRFESPDEKYPDGLNAQIADGRLRKFEI